MRKRKVNGRTVWEDETTGDLLNRSEWVSWQLQTNIIRRWSFLGVFTVITLCCVATLNLSVIGWWNVLASYIAIMVEAVVGRAMFGQTRRDAQIIRELRKMELEDRAHHVEEEQIEGDLFRMVKVLYDSHVSSGK